jgi:hypothetical protein
MRKSLWLIVTVALAGLTFAAAAAFATSGAHFFSSSRIVEDNGALTVSWDEAGVGQEEVNYILTANATATYACINGGGNHPKASNKEDVSGPLASPETTFLPENGRVQGSLSVGPLPSQLECPPGQTFVLACVSYSDIVVTDTTNNVTTEDRARSRIADISRTFVNIAGC